MNEAPEMVFTFLACADLKRICEGIATSTDRWAGTASKNRDDAGDFAQAFSRHCELLAANPEIGPGRDELRDGLRSSDFRKHVIFYRLRAERLEVLRVLPVGRDVRAGSAA